MQQESRTIYNVIVRHTRRKNLLLYVILLYFSLRAFFILQLCTCLFSSFLTNTDTTHIHIRIYIYVCMERIWSVSNDGLTFHWGERSFNDTNITVMCDKGKQKRKKMMYLWLFSWFNSWTSENGRRKKYIL